MRPSRFNLSLERDDRVLLVNLVSRAVLELPADVYALARDDPDELFEFDLPEGLRSLLIEGMFLVDDGFDELEYVRHKVREARYADQELKLVVAPTMGCDFSCHYCFEDKAPTVLSRQDQRRILEYVASRIPGRRALGVQWFGGEPLLAIDVMESLSRGFMALAEAANATYGATLVSNGAHLTKDVAERLAALGVRSVQVTLDGDRRLHEQTRNDHTGGSSYDALLENVVAAREFLEVRVRVHVAPFSIDRIQDLLDDLASRGLADGETELYFAPLFHYVPRSRQSDATRQFEPDEKRFFSAEQFAKVEAELYARSAVAGFRLPELFDTSYGVCTAVQNNTFVLGPRGNIYKCYFDLNQEAERVGSLSEGVSPGPKLVGWMDHEIARDDECKSCSFLPVCFGGCTKKWRTGASKDTICTPFRYNWQELLPLYMDRGCL